MPTNRTREGRGKETKDKRPWKPPQVSLRWFEFEFAVIFFGLFLFCARSKALTFASVFHSVVFEAAGSLVPRRGCALKILIFQAFCARKLTEKQFLGGESCFSFF